MLANLLGPLDFMILITNRAIDETRTDLEFFGDRPNPSGPEELRAVELVGTAANPDLRAIPDQIPPADFGDWGLEDELLLRLGFEDLAEGVPGSAVVAHRLLARLDRLPKRRRVLLIYVHGYNTSMESLLATVERLEKNFGVVCLPFTWPSNGGGRTIWEDAYGYISYLSDKRDARTSEGALDRFLTRVFDYTQALYGAGQEEISREALLRFPHDHEAQLRFQSKALYDLCPVKVNALFHSMGNYLLKHVMLSSAYSSNRLILFDNVVLASADANNENHPLWADRIEFRNNLYITINEDDFALRASRIKGGSEQKARLGHFRHQLDAANAKYIDFTNAPHVGSAHSYFEGDPLKNDEVKAFFSAAFASERGEEEARMRFDPAANVYVFK